jgi:hypothetical protein
MTAQCKEGANTNDTITRDRLLNIVQANTQAKRYAQLPVALPKNDLSESYRVKTCEAECQSRRLRAVYKLLFDQK